MATTVLAARSLSFSLVHSTTGGSPSNTSATMSGFALNHVSLRTTTKRRRRKSNSCHVGIICIAPETSRHNRFHSTNYHSFTGGHFKSSTSSLFMLAKKKKSTDHKQDDDDDDDDDILLSRSWDAVKDKIYNVIDILTFESQPLFLQIPPRRSPPPGSRTRGGMNTVLAVVEQEKDSTSNDDFSSINTLEKHKKPKDIHAAPNVINLSTSTSTSTSTATSSLSLKGSVVMIKDGVYAFLDDVIETYTLITNLPRHVENTVQDTLSKVQAWDREMQRVIINITQIPKNVRSLVENVENSMDETQKSMKQVVLDIQSIPDHIHAFQQNIQYTWEESQRQGREFVETIQSIPLKFQAMGQWIDKSMENNNIVVERKKSSETTKQVRVPVPPVDKSENKDALLLPKTIADIDVELDMEVAEALRVANDALAGKKMDGTEQNGTK